ncbi:hypothetical protein A6A40_26905 (plasmid) [Azospirillum humicireducens]|uniref:Uncharacterized protein n=1 Tax=Azospirillum humicireducens TaxID=1226968 RepID=A0A2R4VW11_9PROT|nr:hypothetical protein A6A40_26905 [Azospirillum humicireducens]
MYSFFTDGPQTTDNFLSRHDAGLDIIFQHAARLAIQLLKDLGGNAGQCFAERTDIHTVCLLRRRC